MGRKRKSNKSELFGHELIVGLAMALVVLFSALFYKAFHSMPINRGQAAATEIPLYYNRVEDAMPLPATLEPAVFKRTDVEEAYQTGRKSLAFSSSSLATATASGKGIAVSWTASRQIMRRVATFASRRHTSQAR